MKILLSANLPPRPGRVVGSPVNGTSLRTIFSITCLSWMDDDLPLKYVYYTAVARVTVNTGDSPPSATDVSFTTTPPSFSSSHGLPLTSGTWIRWVSVIDSLGGMAYSKVVRFDVEVASTLTDEVSQVPLLACLDIGL